MIKRSIIISLFLILTFQTGKAYNAGKWNSYLSYYKIQNVEKANDILVISVSFRKSVLLNVCILLFFVL